MAAPEGARIHDQSSTILSLSLKSRLGLVRRRRRLSFLKQLLAVSVPMLIGTSLVLLAAVGVIASVR